MLLFEAEQLGDHQQGQRGGDVPHGVALAGVDDPVDDPSAEGGHGVLQLADAAGREAPVDQRAPPLVGWGSSMEIIIGSGVPWGRGARWLEKVLGSFSMASTSS